MTKRQSVHALNGKIGALRSWQQMPNKAARTRRTQPGREGLLAKYVRQARADNPALTDEEAEVAGRDLYREHMARMARASSESRKRKTPGQPDDSG